MNDETGEELEVGDARRAEEMEREMELEAFLAARLRNFLVQRALVLLTGPPKGSVNLNELFR